VLSEHVGVQFRWPAGLGARAASVPLSRRYFLRW